MSAFTTQQLSGQKGYRQRTFIGNWSEDMQYQEDEMRDYLRKRDGGNLLSQQIKKKIAHHKIPVELPSAGDGLLHVGQLVALQNGDTEGLLSVDLDDVLTQPPYKKISVSTRPQAEPCLRNTWLFEKLPHPDDEYWAEKGEEDVIHYGQKVRVRLNPELAGPDQKPYYLTSERVTPSCHSRVTQQQEVALANYGTAALAWTFLYANPEFRFEMEGQPVKTNAVTVFTHCQTGQFLASHKKPLLNDFGGEYEIFAKKLYGVQGKNNEVRPEAPFNHWVMVTGLHVNE
ncbi:hypothetical protein DIPPA_27480 [Diplonema papillatum]|nr:hypothetical protein DIPPA_27480 [Diplonema papillatum]